MNKPILDVTLGADIEVFLQHKTTKEIISAEGFIQGTKDNPFVFDASNKYFATSLDNVLAEFCVPPAKTKEEFWANIQKALGYINSRLPDDICTTAFPSFSLHPKYLQTKNAITFGCEPDYNAYSGEQNVKPFCPDQTLRSAGGHIHIGYTTPDSITNMAIIRALDLFIGVPSIIAEPDNKRKELYGKAGAFRHKEYGVEYRTPSNYYLANKDLTMWVHTSAIDAINWLNKGNNVDEGLGQTIQEVINTNNKQEAEMLINHFKIKKAA